MQFAFLDNEGLALHSWFALNNRQVSALSKSPRRQRIDAGQKSASGKSLGRVVGMSDLCLRVRPMDRDLTWMCSRKYLARRLHCELREPFTDPESPLARRLGEGETYRVQKSLWASTVVEAVDRGQLLLHRAMAHIQIQPQKAAGWLPVSCCERWPNLRIRLEEVLSLPYAATSCHLRKSLAAGTYRDRTPTTGCHNGAFARGDQSLLLLGFDHDAINTGFGYGQCGVRSIDLVNLSRRQA